MKINWKTFFGGIGNIFNLFGPITEHKLSLKDIEEDIEDGYKKDSKALKGDWNKVLGDLPVSLKSLPEIEHEWKLRIRDFTKGECRFICTKCGEEYSVKPFSMFSYEECQILLELKRNTKMPKCK